MKKFILLFIVVLVQQMSIDSLVADTKDRANVFPDKDGSHLYNDYTSYQGKKITAPTRLEIPAIAPGETIISHTGYSLVYSEPYEQAKWVAYELTKAETNSIVKRSNKFIPDPLVKSGTASDKDYAGSGYDKGHLAPAADMCWSSKTMAESFYYSNMSPQLPGFNRGVWKRLEELVRAWAIENEDIYVVTGPVLTNGLQSIGPDKVSVPEYYYKVILDYTDPDIKGIGFILPNKGSDEPLQNYAVTIDSVQKFTGIDFFPAIPDNQETKIEKTICLNCWTWKNNQNSN